MDSYEAYKRLVQPKYLEFFSKDDAEYMYEDGVHSPHYIGVAFEFLCDISSSDLIVDYDDLYNNVFKDKKWLYVDYLAGLTDEFLQSLTPIQIVTIFKAIRHKELFGTGFIRICGQYGIIIRLLRQLESKLEEGECYELH